MTWTGYKNKGKNQTKFPQIPYTYECKLGKSIRTLMELGAK
jgi:hypothetical protein